MTQPGQSKSRPRWRAWLHRRCRRGCNGRNFHVWGMDPLAVSDRSVFHRIDCVYCGTVIDGAVAKWIARELGWFPGRVAEPDELPGGSDGA